MAPPNSLDNVLNSMLRSRLTWITTNLLFQNTQEREVERMRESTGHTIYALKLSTTDPEYNCVSYALGLTKDTEYHRLVNQFVNTHADTAFVQHLINCKAIVPQLTRKAGLLGVYDNGGTITHVGLFSSCSHLTSKWGLGLLWEHGAFEVPDIYGNNLQAFSTPDPATIRQQFITYARGQGEVI